MALYNNPYQYSFGVPGQMNQFQQQPVQMPAQPVQQPQQNNNGILLGIWRSRCEVLSSSTRNKCFTDGFRIREILYKIHRRFRNATAITDV